MQRCPIFWGHIYTDRLSADAKGTCPSDFLLTKNLASSLVYATLHPVECYSLQLSSQDILQNISKRGNKLHQRPCHFGLRVSVLSSWNCTAGSLTSPAAVKCHGLLVKEKARALKSKGSHSREAPAWPGLTFLSFPLPCRLDDVQRLPFYGIPTVNFNLRTVSLSFSKFCFKEINFNMTAFYLLL